VTPRRRRSRTFTALLRTEGLAVAGFRSTRRKALYPGALGTGLGAENEGSILVVRDGILRNGIASAHDGVSGHSIAWSSINEPSGIAGRVDQPTALVDGKREQAQEHLVTATTMYREMDMRFWLEQAEKEGA